MEGANVQIVGLALGEVKVAWTGLEDATTYLVEEVLTNIQLLMNQYAQARRAVGVHLYMLGGLVVAAMADQNKTPYRANPNVVDIEHEQPRRENQWVLAVVAQHNVMDAPKWVLHHCGIQLPHCSVARPWIVGVRVAWTHWISAKHPVQQCSPDKKSRPWNSSDLVLVSLVIVPRTQQK